MVKTIKDKTIKMGLSLIIMLVLVSIVAVVLSTILIGSNIEANHQDQLTAIGGVLNSKWDAVECIPLEICHDEVITEKVNIYCGMGIYVVPEGAEYICEEGILVEEDGAGYHTIFGCGYEVSLTYDGSYNGTCMIKTTTEVCEVSPT